MGSVWYPFANEVIIEAIEMESKDKEEEPKPLSEIPEEKEMLPSTLYLWRSS